MTPSWGFSRISRGVATGKSSTRRLTAPGKEFLFGMVQHEALDRRHDTAEHFLGNGAVPELGKIETFQVVIAQACFGHPAHEIVHAAAGTSTAGKLKIDMAILTWPGDTHVGVRACLPVGALTRDDRLSRA